MIKTTRLKTSQVPKNITYDLTPQVDGVTQTFELPEKVYDLDQHYVLFNGQVYRNDGNHTFYTISADGMELTTLFDEAPRPGASYVLQFVKTEIAEGDGAASKSYVDGKVADEATARENADIALGQRIDTVVAASDVKDIVGTHADLEAYDTSTLGDNDIIKVLADETQSGKISYYRWNATSSQFSLIGSEGPYQMALTAGSNITIDANNEISATDTTYSNFVGTDGVDAGAAGLVPAPATTDAGKFLKADGTWDTAGSSITLYTTYGQNTDGAMTQKAITDLVYASGDPTKVVIGDSATTTNSSVAIGPHAQASQGSSEGHSVAIGLYARNQQNGVSVGDHSQASKYSTAVGAYAGNNSLLYAGYSTFLGYSAGAYNNNKYTVGLGAYSSPRADGVVDVSLDRESNSTHGYNSTGYRVISGVHNGEQLHDAATVAQGNTLATSAPTTTTTGVLGQLYTDTTAMHTYQCTAIDTTDPDNPVYTWTQRW